jgi:hypothetical protein
MSPASGTWRRTIKNFLADWCTEINFSMQVFRRYLGKQLGKVVFIRANRFDNDAAISS